MKKIWNNKIKIETFIYWNILKQNEEFIKQSHDRDLKNMSLT